MKFYLVRNPGWYIEQVGDFPTLKEAEDRMLGGMAPANWRELMEAEEYYGRYHVLDHEEFTDIIAMNLNSDPNLLSLIHLGFMEDFTDRQAEDVFNLMREQPDLNLSEAVVAVKRFRPTGPPVARLETRPPAAVMLAR